MCIAKLTRKMCKGSENSHITSYTTSYIYIILLMLYIIEKNVWLYPNCFGRTESSWEYNSSGLHFIWFITNILVDHLNLASAGVPESSNNRFAFCRIGSKAYDHNINLGTYIERDNHSPFRSTTFQIMRFIYYYRFETFLLNSMFDLFLMFGDKLRFRIHFRQ